MVKGLIHFGSPPSFSCCTFAFNLGFPATQSSYFFFTLHTILQQPELPSSMLLPLPLTFLDYVGPGFNPLICAYLSLPISDAIK